MSTFDLRAVIVEQLRRHGIAVPAGVRSGDLEAATLVASENVNWTIAGREELDEDDIRQSVSVMSGLIAEAVNGREIRAFDVEVDNSGMVNVRMRVPKGEPQSSK